MEIMNSTMIESVEVMACQSMEIVSKSMIRLLYIARTMISSMEAILRQIMRFMVKAMVI